MLNTNGRVKLSMKLKRSRNEGYITKLKKNLGAIATLVYKIGGNR